MMNQLYVPTVEIDGKVHLVKSQKYCECHIQYCYFEQNRKDRRKIKFKPLTKIDCPQCKDSLLAVEPNLVSVRA
ncbi:hypothetical protein ACIQD3_12100 [Peribacillus loiseleuriae]|uniref:Uncharacterized protein n=1 Tax=Peribacillus loiseleuriae TaxID=1679170 RepID=A0A0K9GYV1_9BACI|nr:hypothetical protein [Peribacillus loiseleuriae]KMY51823.1 hypothetical protein AC625_21735 [Peribacillus loiseleuriae]